MFVGPAFVVSLFRGASDSVEAEFFHPRVHDKLCSIGRLTRYNLHSMGSAGPWEMTVGLLYCQELCRQVSDALNPYSSGFVQCPIC